ncbi:hypothetical protein CR513_37502, partial [Mucuna pruriens]
MEDETSRKRSTLILGRLFLMTAKTKNDVHARTLSIEFGDTSVQFNIFEAIKHPTEDHSLFGIDLIDELVEEYFQLDSHSEDTDKFAKRIDLISCLGSISKEAADYTESGEVHNLSDFVDNNKDIANLDFEAELLEVLDQVCKQENLECSIRAEVQVAETEKLFATQLATIFTTEDDAESNSNPERRILVKRSRPQQPKAKIMSAHLVPSSTQVGQPDPKASNTNSSSPPPPMELKPLPGHLKYVYLDVEQQLPVIVANNLHREQEDKLLQVLREHKKAIGWKLFDLLGINPSIYMHRILMEEEAKPIRQQ